MSEVNKLKSAAIAATPGPWIVGAEDRMENGNLYGIYVSNPDDDGSEDGRILECFSNCLVTTDADVRANAEFIAAANPAAVLELLAERDADKKRIAELERITEGVDQLAIDGGWTARGMSEYAKTLERKLALPAVADVLAERQRQVSEKGYTPESDDSYLPGILCLAGAAYAVAASAFPDARRRANRLWPWPNAPKYFDPARKSNPRVNLVKSAALIIAEIERLDRAASGKS